MVKANFINNFLGGKILHIDKDIDENIKYLDLRLNSNPIEEEALQEILDTLKIEEGDNATSYSPYRTR